MPFSLREIRLLKWIFTILGAFGFMLTAVWLRPWDPILLILSTGFYLCGWAFAIMERKMEKPLTH